MYNGPASKFGLIGIRASNCFEDQWAKSGLDQAGALRHRRSTAGIAAAKYEPALGPEERPKASSGPANSGRAKKVQEPALGKTWLMMSAACIKHYSGNHKSTSPYKQ